ncbi:LysR family transcriptional regulator [Streptomyces pseudovenezuelae]|uniref:LysR family transcriptional regulator n=1 Tax=Streptomyces pseudovenezuelae TaxID=67350 RepID=UPI002E3451B4|nr:LysR family transcriptional regulator [Streptomyces pseudovenezuelae]
MAPDTVSLRYFLVLAQELNFTRAAARIGIAQSALSARIRRLETELGNALLVRNTRSVVLTTAGAALAESAPPALAALDRAWDTARRGGGGGGPVSWARSASDTASAPGPRRLRPWWTS